MGCKGSKVRILSHRPKTIEINGLQLTAVTHFFWPGCFAPAGQLWTQFETIPSHRFPRGLRIQRLNAGLEFFTKRMCMRLLLGLRVCVWAIITGAAGLSYAQAPLLMAISEGTSGGLDHAQVIAKYQGMADAIGAALKAKVNVVFAREFATLESGMRSGRFAFVMARPTDYPARGIRDHGYTYVTNAKPDGQCLIIVRKDSPIDSLDAVKSKRIVMPEAISYMSRFCTAELRDRGISLVKEDVKYVREQAAVGFYLNQKFSDVGAIASYSGLAKKLDKEGLKVLHKSVAQPYFPLVAAKGISAEQIHAIQKALAALPETEAGMDVLKRIGIEAFDTTGGPRTLNLLKWLEP
jgi:phosphonate transport system substrate-binding protein